MDAIRFGSHIRLKDMAALHREFNQVDDETHPGHELVTTDFSQRAFANTGVKVRESDDGKDLILQTNVAHGDYFGRNEELTALYEALSAFGNLSELDLAQKEKLQNMAANVRQSVQDHEATGSGAFGTNTFQTELVFDSKA